MPPKLKSQRTRHEARPLLCSDNDESMKRILFLALTIVLLISCGKENSSNPQEQTVPGETVKMEAVDLGLSVKWATMNLGASRPEECGDFYAWGETEPKSEYNSTNYRFGLTSSASTLTKYSKKDNKAYLDLSDDAAHVKLGGSWRMPTMREFQELLGGCKWTWTSNYKGTGVVGFIISSKVPGHTGNSIFLPAAGYCSGTLHAQYGESGNYWSSFLMIDRAYFAWHLHYDIDKETVAYDYRHTGYPIRPVSE